MNKLKIEIRWAFIFMGLTLLWMWIEKMVGLHSINIDKHPVYTMFFVLPTIIVYILAIRDKKKNFYGGNMTFREGFTAGMVMSFIVMLFSPITQYIISEIISPEFFPNIIEYSVRTGYYKTAEEAAAYFNLKNYMIQSASGAIGMGTILSLIVAFLNRSK